RCAIGSDSFLQGNHRSSRTSRRFAGDKVMKAAIREQIAGSLRKAVEKDLGVASHRRLLRVSASLRRGLIDDFAFEATVDLPIHVHHRIAVNLRIVYPTIVRIAEIHIHALDGAGDEILGLPRRWM